MKTGDPLGQAAERDADLVQLFLSNPKSWKPPAPRADADALRAWPGHIYVHAPYLVNLVSPNPRVRIPSRTTLRQCCQAAAAIDARAVIVHGGHLSPGNDFGDEDVETGALRWVKALRELESPVPVYLENTAGGERAMARDFDTLARLWDQIGPLGVGFCLDTCHAWAAGEELISAAERVFAITGRIDLVHCNDSRDVSGSGRDRHANLGQGNIPLDILMDMVRSAGAPTVVETPGEGQRDDIALLKRALASG